MAGLMRGRCRVLVAAMFLAGVVGLYLGFLISPGDRGPTTRVSLQNVQKNDGTHITHFNEETADHLEDALRCSQPEPRHEETSTVFLKTHKTGSSTIASILQRYGYSHNKTFLVPTIGSLICYVQRFNACRINPNWQNATRGYDLLTNHARYDRQEMATVFGKARYVTILREPVAQFESAFYYFDIPDGLPASSNSLSDFMSNPMKNFVELQTKHQYVKHSVYNQQLFDFGVQHAEMFRADVIEEKIAEIDRNFHLVMICEYFDESLVLLRKLLNWRMDDMVYFVKGTRASKFSHKDELGPELRAKIRAWNAGDVKLYEHFNRTFWRKVAAYGPMFAADVAELRLKVANASSACFNTSQSITFVREEHFALRKDAPPWCKDVYRSDFDFTGLIRRRMKTLGVPLYDFKEAVPPRKSANAKKSQKKIKKD